MRIGPSDRGGFTPWANAENERVFNGLRPMQALLYVGLRTEAQYGGPGERRDAFGRVVVLQPGEVLFGIDSVAQRYGLKRDQVRRAVERFEQLGLVSRRAGVAAAIPHGPRPAIPRGPEAATPPTVLTFLTDREICWRAKEPATPHGPLPATPHGPVATPIQPEPETPKLSPSPAAPARAGRHRTTRKGGSETAPDPRHRPLQERLEAVFREVRHVAYGFQGGRDGKAVAELLRLSGGDGAEVEQRWRRALELRGKYPGCSTISLLAARWNELAVMNAASPAASPQAFAGQGGFHGIGS